MPGSGCSITTRRATRATCDRSGSRFDDRAESGLILRESLVKDLATILINGRKIQASPGDTLLDAGLANRIVIPHDCCTGQCTTCRVRVYDGEVNDEGTRDGDMVLACQATVSGHAVIEFDEVPLAAKRSGT